MRIDNYLSIRHSSHVHHHDYLLVIYKINSVPRPHNSMVQYQIKWALQFGSLEFWTVFSSILSGVHCYITGQNLPRLSSFILPPLLSPGIFFLRQIPCSFIHWLGSQESFPSLTYLLLSTYLKEYLRYSHDEMGFRTFQ